MAQSALLGIETNELVSKIPAQAGLVPVDRSRAQPCPQPPLQNVQPKAWRSHLTLANFVELRDQLLDRHRQFRANVRRETSGSAHAAKSMLPPSFSRVSSPRQRGLSRAEGFCRLHVTLRRTDINTSYSHEGQIG